MTGPRKARTDVWDKVKTQRDQPQGGTLNVDPWLGKSAQWTTQTTQKNPWQSWKGTEASDKPEKMQVQQDPPVNIMEMVTKEQTRGELSGAAMKMSTIQEAVTNQQTRMSKVEEVITTTAASAAADQKKTQDMVERMMRMLKEKRKKPDTDVELDEDPL